MTSTYATEMLPGATDESSSVVVASHPTYLEAQRAVDHLSDSGFPVRSVSIVGRGVTTVEQVTGRRTNGRAALTGAAGGAWTGLFVGLLLGMFTAGIVWVSVLLTGLVLGALFGAVVGFVSHWSTRGRRDFSSVQTLAAERYDILVTREHATRAAQLLAVPAVS